MEKRVEKWSFLPDKKKRNSGKNKPTQDNNNN